MKKPGKADNPGSVEERLARLETKMSDYEEDMRELRSRMNRLENELEHIRQALAKHSVYFKIIGAIGSATLMATVTIVLFLLLGI